MADSEFQVESIGEVYAQALIIEAQKQNALDQVAEDVRGIGELLKNNKMFHGFTQALTISEDQRVATLDKLFKGHIHELTLNAIKSMARRDRLMFLRGLVAAFLTIRKKMSGHVDVELVAASEMRSDVLQRVTDAIGKSEARIADIKVKIDPALIGGMTVRIGDTLIDGSVAQQLNKIKEQLKRGAGLKASAIAD
jgi:F-type H+-transporting ATPase subunit delta